MTKQKNEMNSDMEEQEKELEDLIMQQRYSEPVEEYDIFDRMRAADLNSQMGGNPPTQFWG